MSDLAERRQPSEQPLYMLWMVLLIIGFTVLQWGILAGVYFFTYGTPTLGEFMTMEAPAYAQSTLWKGRIIYPVTVMGPNPSSQRSGGSLISFDPEKGGSQRHDVTIPIPKTGMIADGDTLWCVSPSLVTRVRDDQSMDTTPKHSLKHPYPPFLYHQQPAVIDWVAGDAVLLRTFDGEDWIDRGRIEIPATLARTTDGSNRLIANLGNEAALASQAGRSSPLDIRVVSEGDRLHLFVSDGVNVAYRRGIEFVQASALAPDNVPNPAELDNWEDVGQVVVRSGPLKKSTWTAGLVKGEPVVLTAASTSTSPFGNSTVTVFGRSEGTWTEASHMSMPSLFELFAFSDGEQTYVAGQPAMPSLRFYKLVNQELQPTGAFLKAPSAASESRIEWVSRCMAWVYWPLLIVFAWSVTWLMKNYTSPQYQFGAQTVELASYTRRVIARLIDHVFFVIPSYFIVVACGFGSSQKVQENMDRMFDLGPDSLLLRYVWMMAGLIALAFTLLVINSALQARWGLTLGKWICGIRTKRATLRPCGFLRAMLRELLLVADTFLGSITIPATLAIAFTNSRQRLGDLVADTIVIRKPRREPDSDSTIQTH